MDTQVNLSTHRQMSDKRFDHLKHRTRAAFLTAGLELILEKGYDAVSVSDIAQLADYGRSTFYLHFRDKEDLVWTLLKNQMAQLDQQVVTAVAGLPSPQREFHAWEIIFATIDAQRPFFLQLDSDLSRRLRQMQKECLIENFARQLRDGVFSLLLDVPPEIGARFIVGALLELLDYWLHYPEASSAEALARYMFRLVFRTEPELSSLVSEPLHQPGGLGT